MRNALITVVTIALAIAGGWYLYEYGTVSKGSGSYALQVRLTSEKPIRAVKCVTSFSRNEAEIVRNERDEWDIAIATGKADPFTGAPVEVRIETWGDFSRSGREIAGGQQEWLVVIATFADDQRAAKLVKVPDMMQSREVDVAFP